MRDTDENDHERESPRCLVCLVPVILIRMKILPPRASHLSWGGRRGGCCGITETCIICPTVYKEYDYQRVYPALLTLFSGNSEYAEDTNHHPYNEQTAAPTTVQRGWCGQQHY